MVLPIYLLAQGLIMGPMFTIIIKIVNPNTNFNNISISYAKVYLFLNNTNYFRFYNSIFFAAIFCAKNTEAESENLLADSVVKNVQLPFAPNMARSAISE